MRVARRGSIREAAGCLPICRELISYYSTYTILLVDIPEMTSRFVSGGTIAGDDDGGATPATGGEREREGERAGGDKKNALSVEWETVQKDLDEERRRREETRRANVEGGAGERSLYEVLQANKGMFECLYFPALAYCGDVSPLIIFSFFLLYYRAWVLVVCYDVVLLYSCLYSPHISFAIVEVDLPHLLPASYIRAFHTFLHRNRIAFSSKLYVPTH